MERCERKQEMSRFVVIVMGGIAAVLMPLSLFSEREEEESIHRFIGLCLLFGVLVCLYEIAFVGG
jgi:hypothetical protein